MTWISIWISNSLVFPLRNSMDSFGSRSELYANWQALWRQHFLLSKRVFWRDFYMTFLIEKKGWQIVQINLSAPRRHDIQVKKVRKNIKKAYSRVGRWLTNEGQQRVWNLPRCNWHPHCRLTSSAVDRPLLLALFLVTLKTENSFLFSL